jgi:hypothetical protein
LGMVTPSWARWTEPVTMASCKGRPIRASTGAGEGGAAGGVVDAVRMVRRLPGEPAGLLDAARVFLVDL